MRSMMPTKRVLLVIWAVVFSILMLSVFFGQTARGEAAIALSLPVDCALGEGCFVQQTPDRAAGPEAADFRCGIASYDGHAGVDIRLVSLADIAADVAVLAAAPGVVLGVRDGMPDRLVRSAEARRAVENRECGNGVVLDHGDGWVTQYCHLKRGSVRVRSGDQVARGEALGAIGSSGLSAFPHLEFLIRSDGADIDPFTGEPLTAACGAGEASALWDAEARRALGDAPAEGAPIALGFAGAPLEFEALMRAAPPAPDRGSQALVGYALITNAREGDVLSLSFEGPRGFRVANDTPLTRNRAQQMSFVGQRRTVPAWPAGAYVLRVRVLRGDVVLAAAERRMELR